MSLRNPWISSDSVTYPLAIHSLFAPQLHLIASIPRSALCPRDLHEKKSPVPEASQGTSSVPQCPHTLHDLKYPLHFGEFSLDVDIDRVSAMMEKSNFKVIIVGGSISGLTLAHCLAKANIDHIILEKRAEIAPQEGAFIGIWPNGARILQQLGVYSSLEKLTAPIHRMHISYPDQFSFSSLLPKKVHEMFVTYSVLSGTKRYFSDLLHQRFGYPIISIDRQKILEILLNLYPKKSKVLTNKRVSEVRLGEHRASVLTDDGSMFEGDLIVGADGVHSRTRSEMWRLADDIDPGYISQSDKTGS